AIEKRGGHDSIARIVSIDLGINHIFCDPTSKEREQLGIPSCKQIRESLGIHIYLKPDQDKQIKLLEAEERKYWGIREKFWLKSLQNQYFTCCLFILGSSHVQSFKKLLNMNNIDVLVVHENWMD
ncbi:MAG TPA: hypothetical protein PLB09_11545, partial [Deltaproteobacteria bacterium]|nr:hypothetical protein [Deltaproteobacteria bacterium]